MYSYVLVDKTREVYTKKENNIEYNVMVDKIKNIGVFVEFELLANEDFGIEPLTTLLDSFVGNFKSLNLEKALLPYRDYCAQYVYNKYLKNMTTIVIDFDDLIFNTNNVTEDYNTITNLKLLNKIKNLKNNNISFEIVSNLDKEYISNFLEKFKCNHIFSNIYKKEDIKESSSNTKLILTHSNISNITKNLTQLLLIYLNNCN